MSASISSLELPNPMCGGRSKCRIRLLGRLEPPLSWVDVRNGHGEVVARERAVVTEMYRCTTCNSEWTETRK